MKQASKFMVNVLLVIHQTYNYCHLIIIHEYSYLLLLNK